MLTLRKIVFYLFVVIYLTLCPLTILYALGYLFKPGAEHGVVRTGLLYLSTAPAGASVYFRGTRYAEKTPTMIRDLLPGDYPLTLALKNHKPWTQSVSLEAGKSTVLDKILLLPRQWKPRELSIDSFEELIPLPGNPFFLLKKGPNTQDYVVYDMEEGKGWPLFPMDSPVRGVRVLSWVSLQESPSLLLRVDSQRGKQFLWVEPREKEPLLEDLTDLFVEKPLRVEWDPHERRYLFAFRDGHLNRLDVETKTLLPGFLEGIRGMGLFHKMIYVLREDGTFQRMDEDGKNEEVILSAPAITRPLFGGSGFIQVKVLSKNLILFLGEDGELLANRLPYRFVEEGVRGFDFDASRERLLLWKSDAIGILDFSKEPMESDLFERGPRLVWAFKKGRDIEQAFWVHEGSHLLFRDRENIYLLELETPGNPHLESLLRVKGTSSIAYSEATGRLYYLEPVKGRLCSIEIVPQKSEAKER